jgi:glycosyltransferase involved in cell wall biosynthesis
VNILFLAHCTREKGLFVAIEGVLAANRQFAARRLPMKLRLTLAGNFVTESEQAEFAELGKNPGVASAVAYAGFVSGERKEQLYREADLFLFPTQYLGENQPVNLIEAMAFGLPIVTTRWRSLPEMLPPNYPGLVSGQNTDEIATALLKVLALKSGELARAHFTANFTIERHLTTLAEAIHSVETETPSLSPAMKPV